MVTRMVAGCCQRMLSHARQTSMAKAVGAKRGKKENRRASNSLGGYEPETGIELPAELESKGLRGKGCRKRVLFGLASVKVYALGIYKAEQDDKQTVFCISMARDLPGEKVLEALKERFDSYGVPESDSKQLEPVFAEKVRKGSTLVIATDRIAGTVSLRWSHGQGGSRPTVVVSQSLCDAIVDSYLGADPAVPRAKEEFERSFCPAT